MVQLVVTLIGCCCPGFYTLASPPEMECQTSVWQWSVPVVGMVSPETNDHPRAFLYIPPTCVTVRGVIIGQHNMLEEPILEHAAVRQAMADVNMAAVWVTPAFDGNFNFTKNPETPEIFQEMMDALAVVSGYAELSQTPVVWIGHSAMAKAPYHFAAWDAQHSEATGAPRRCAAGISVRGYYPTHASGDPVYEDSDLNGVPILYVEGEYADADGRETQFLNLINANSNWIVSMFSDVGSGHFDWNARSSEYIAMYLRKLGQYRLPTIADPDGTATLIEIDAGSKGWHADRWRKGQVPTAAPAPVASYAGNAAQAFWYFDQESAETVNDMYQIVKTDYQLLGYTQNGTLVDQTETHQQVNLSFIPDPDGDGRTFKLGTAFLDTVPSVSSRLTGWTGQPVGSEIGHASSGVPILISRICGPVEQLSPDTFRVRFDRVGLNNIYGQNRTRDIWLMAVHPGDDDYVAAVQQALLRIPFPLTQGAPQTIHFSEIDDQIVGANPIELRAKTTGSSICADAEVQFYVREGPAVLNGNTLAFTSIPPGAKFPIRVTVVATQYGRKIEPKLQTADPVVRTFRIHESANAKSKFKQLSSLLSVEKRELDPADY